MINYRWWEYKMIWWWISWIEYVSDLGINVLQTNTSIYKVQILFFVTVLHLIMFWLLFLILFLIPQWKTTQSSQGLPKETIFGFLLKRFPGTPMRNIGLPKYFQFFIIVYQSIQHQPYLYRQTLRTKIVLIALKQRVITSYT